jgi:hypothetical protein
VKWTSKEPTVPGWYWVKSYDGHFSVRHVVARAYGLRIIVRGREHEFGRFAEFAGPIPEPDTDEDGS